MIVFKWENFLKYLARACYVHRTDSWSFWIFEWMPLLVFSLQQYIIGIQELYIFYFYSHKSALCGRRQEHFSWACASLLSWPESSSPSELLSPLGFGAGGCFLNAGSWLHLEPCPLNHYLCGQGPGICILTSSLRNPDALWWLRNTRGTPESHSVHGAPNTVSGA